MRRGSTAGLSCGGTVTTRERRSISAAGAETLREQSVRPVLTLDRDDNRVFESRDVMDLDDERNLATIDWEDHEHVVRELFSKMFTARSSAAEVHVTRASRD
jgi:hypothetical protein